MPTLLYAVVVLAMIGTVTAAETVEQRRDAWLDPDLASFTLRNAGHIRYEVRNGGGHRLHSLLQELALTDQEVDVNCIRRIAAAEPKTFGFYLGIMEAKSRCKK